MAIVITNGIIVNSEGKQRKDIRIVDEKIDEIGVNIIKDGDETIDAKGYYIMPGGIDVHTHFECEAGGIIADDFGTGTRAAIMGGTTTIIDFAEQLKGETLREAFNKWNKMTLDRTYTDYGYHMTIGDWNNKTSEEMKEIMEEGITSFKMFFVYDDLKMDDKSIYEALKRAKELGGLIGFHCENGDMVDILREESILKGNTKPIFHAHTRPATLERDSISRLLTIAELLDTRVYIVHLSSKEGYDEIQRARKRGSKVMVETCPHYLLLTKESYIPKGKDEFEGAKYVMSPPLRDKKSNEVLWEGISGGEIDVVATDHCAFNYKGQKDLGINDFTKIPNGAPGVEDRFKLMYSYGVRENRIGIEKLVEVISEKPAKIFGLYPRKGVIKEGSDADIVIFNPENVSTIRAKDQTQNVDYNLYEGFTKYGKFEYVFLRGKMVVKDEKIIVSSPTGKYQKRNKYII